VSTTALVLWIIALVLLAFGVVFALLGMNSERAYWTQRDPSGDARSEATRLSSIMRRAGHFATGEYRAPLRIAAIGVLMGELAIGFAVVALIATLAG
jgi:thiosulfate reductase cytochrome b subunit